MTTREQANARLNSTVMTRIAEHLHRFDLEPAVDAILDALQPVLDALAQEIEMLRRQVPCETNETGGTV